MNMNKNLMKHNRRIKNTSNSEGSILKKNFDSTYPMSNSLNTNGIEETVEQMTNGIKKGGGYNKNLLDSYTHGNDVDCYTQGINEIKEENKKREDGYEPLFPYVFYQGDKRSGNVPSLYTQFKDDINEPITLGNNMLRQQVNKINGDAMMEMNGEKMTHLVPNISNANTSINNFSKPDGNFPKPIGNLSTSNGYLPTPNGYISASNGNLLEQFNRNYEKVHRMSHRGKM